jgi:YD repeat-containing protein
MPGCSAQRSSRRRLPSPRNDLTSAFAAHAARPWLAAIVHTATDPDGGTTRYTYDAANRMLTLMDRRNIV